VGSQRVNSARSWWSNFSIGAAAAGSVWIVASIRKSFAGKIR
jgi:hypothetical protein